MEEEEASSDVLLVTMLLHVPNLAAVHPAVVFFFEELQAHGPRDHRVLDSANRCELSAFIVAITRYGSSWGPLLIRRCSTRTKWPSIKAFDLSPEPPVRRDTQCLASHKSWPTLVWTIRRSFWHRRSTIRCALINLAAGLFFQWPLSCTVAAASISAS